MAADRHYSSPAAFRRALTDRLQGLVKHSRWSLPQLQRQIAYDRLLERLYLTDDAWIVKGAKRCSGAEADLREAAQQDIGDWFRFEIGPGRPVSVGAAGIRLPVTTFIGATEWCSFHVDLVGPEVRATGKPEHVPPVAPVTMPDVQQHGYRAYPLIDHIADKVAAILQTYGPQRFPSTRYKDLVDLVAIVSRATIDARSQRVALESETDRPGVGLPEAFSAPDRELWRRATRRKPAGHCWRWRSHWTMPSPS